MRPSAAAGDAGKRRSTFRLGVNGSGSLMLRGKALRIRLRSWMQLGGMTSQKP